MTLTTCDECGRAYDVSVGCTICERENSRLGAAPEKTDPVNRPSHYTGHPSGVECIAIIEHMNFCRGNAMKYLWRAGEKGNEIEDLKKARWYIDREIARLEKDA